MMIKSSTAVLVVAMLAATTTIVSSDSSSDEECVRIVSTRLNYFGPYGERRVPHQVLCAPTSAVVLSETDDDDDDDDDRRRRQRKLDSGMGSSGTSTTASTEEVYGQVDLPIPYPTHGSFHQLGNAIHFRQHVAPSPKAAIADLNCFKFQKADGSHDRFTICDGDDDNRVKFSKLDAGTDDAAVEMQLTGLQAAKWIWYAEDSQGGTTGAFEFTIEEATTTPPASSESSESSEEGGDIKLNSEVVKVEEAEWTKAGVIQGATGRIYYESAGYDYACTGTVIRDAKSGRSLILTAAHCVWDDIDGLWGTNVIFIPNRDAIQTDLTSKDIKRQCEQDICGCWKLSAGVVHSKWKTEPWPDRLHYDYGLYVVDDEGMHSGTSCGDDALDKAVEEMEFVVGMEIQDLKTHSLGYSLEHNPDFRYCLDETGFRKPPHSSDDINTYWLPSCGLTGGASGGPWVMDMDRNGKGKIVSVNSWSLSDISGMGGPIIDASEARCLVNEARKLDFKEIYAREPGEQGEFVDHCHNLDCITREEANAMHRLLRGRGLPLGGHRRLCEHNEEDTKKV